MTKEIKNRQKTVYLELELYNKLEKKAEQEHRSMSNLIIKILSEKMEDGK